MQKLIQILISLFLIFSIIPFFPESVYAILNNIYVYHHFESNISSEIPSYLNFKYIKDYIMVVLLLIMNLDLFKNKKFSNKLALLSIIISSLIIWGTFNSLYIQNNFSFLQLIAGIRPFMLILISIQILFYINKDTVGSFIKVVTSLLYVELIIILLQYLIYTRYFGIVNPVSIRLLGTFGGIANVAYFALGVGLIHYINYSNNYKISFNYTLINLVTVTVISAFSGTRAALVASVFLLIIFMVNKRRVFFPKKLQYLALSLMIFLSFTIPIIINTASELSGRGSMIQQQASGGRIDFFISFFRDSSITEILLGKGIGVGTNTALILNERLGINLESTIMDGTLNVILMQFGVLILIVYLSFYGAWIYHLIRNSRGNILLAIVIILINTIMNLTMNIFELFSYLPFFFIGVFLYYNPLVINRHKDSKNNYDVLLT